MDLTERLIKQALMMGASYVGIIHHKINSSLITIENGALKNYLTRKTSGLGIRVLVDHKLGIASSTDLNLESLGQHLEYAIKMAKNSKDKTESTNFSEIKVVKDSVKLPIKKTFDSVSDKEKITTALDTNKSAMLEGVKNSTTYLAWLIDRRTFRSSEGTEVTCEVPMTGLAQVCVSSFQGYMESVSDSRSECTGLEFLSKTDWCQFSREIAETSLKAVRAKIPKAGFYEVIADPDLIGLILHEAFGHASEADLVITKESILDGCISKEVASPLITIIDDGIVNGGYFFSYDDEGVAKRRQTVIEKGVLRGFLHSRETAYKMGVLSTGNARAQSVDKKPIVRQSNLFMDGGDQNFDELLNEVDDGLYICGRGARGGEVDVGLGTFTFRCGPSYIIRKGDIKEMVKSVSISGMILETLKNVEAVGKDVKIVTSIFGGCGKDGQIARVGHGGPHVRIGRLAVGGSA